MVLSRKSGLPSYSHGRLSLEWRKIERIASTKAWLCHLLFRSGAASAIISTSHHGVESGPTNENNVEANGWWKNFGGRGIKDLPKS